MSNNNDNAINHASITGRITWLHYDPDHQKTTFTVQNDCGYFYVEGSTDSPPVWKTGDQVWVHGSLYSRNRKGRIETRIRADSVVVVQ